MSPTANSARGGAFPTHEPAAHHGAWGGIVLAGLVFAITAVILGLTAEDASVVESIGVAALGAIALVAVITNAVRGASERAGRRYERPLTWLLRSSTDLVMVLDARGRIVYMNPASERLLGRRPDHVLGDELTELVHPEETGAVQALFGDLRGRAGALGKSSLRMVHDDGSTRHFEVAATNMLHDRDVHGIGTSPPAILYYFESKASARGACLRRGSLLRRARGGPDPDSQRPRPSRVAGRVCVAAGDYDAVL